MELKPNPFSFYDFLGYFTPGALAIYGGMIIWGHMSGPISIDQAIRKLSFEDPKAYIPFVLLAYLLGHLLSFLSSVIVEKYAIWSCGYPSRFLLQFDVAGYWDVKSKRERAVRGFVGFLLLPIALLDVTVGYLLYLRNLYSRELDAELISIIKVKIESLIKNRGQIPNQKQYRLEKDHDFFRYVYHYAVEHAHNHLPKMQNYVALYGFLRTISLIFVIAWWLIAGHMVHRLYRIWVGDDPNWIALTVALAVFAALSYVSYMGFMKFYRRFSLEALMAVSAVYQAESNSALQRTRRNNAPRR